jgi:hypothetical protein
MPNSGKNEPLNLPKSSHSGWEIPPLKLDVTEHRGFGVRCPHCDVLVPAADLPEGTLDRRRRLLGVHRRQPHPKRRRAMIMMSGRCRSWE